MPSERSTTEPRVRSGAISRESPAIAKSPTTCCRRPTIVSCARKIAWEGESHRRAYLFRIATNLVRDGRRRARSGQTVPLPDGDREERWRQSARTSPNDVARRADLRRAMDRLRPRDRALLWLAYAQGHAHSEIAETLGVKTGSVKLLLFRARRKLAGLLRATHGRTGGGTTRDDR